MNAVFFVGVGFYFFTYNFIDMDIIFEGEYTPTQATERSAGFDLRAFFNAAKYVGTCQNGDSIVINTARNFIGMDKYKFIKIPPGVRLMIPTGIRIQPQRTDGLRVFFMLCLRSSIGTKRGLIMPHGVGIIDADFTGEIMVVVYNATSKDVKIQHGERIAQIVPIINPNINFIKGTIQNTNRGGGGFGSTNE